MSEDEVGSDNEIASALYYICKAIENADDEGPHGRDARAAVSGLLANNGGQLGYSNSEVVQRSFAIADAMQVERDRREKGEVAE